MYQPHFSLAERVQREVERERQERSRLDEERANLAADEDFRIKDARENSGIFGSKRQSGR